MLIFAILLPHRLREKCDIYFSLESRRIICKGTGKIHPRTGHEGPEVE
jgi:hypothetical protein